MRRATAKYGNKMFNKPVKPTFSLRDFYDSPWAIFFLYIASR